MTIALLFGYTKLTLVGEAENKHQNQACIYRTQFYPSRLDLAQKVSSLISGQAGLGPNPLLKF